MEVISRWEGLTEYIREEKITENDVCLLMAGEGCTDYTH